MRNQCDIFRRFIDVAGSPAATDKSSAWIPALVLSAVLLMPALAARAYDQHFDYTSFENSATKHFQQAQFNVLNYPSINGNYMMTSTDNHRPEMVANGNALAQFYNPFCCATGSDYLKNPRPTATEEADAIHAYTIRNSTRNGPRPEWLILNEISPSLWQQNPGDPSLNAFRTWVIECVTRLTDVYGYKVITLSPYQQLGTTANAPSWQALAAKSYVAIEAYLSGAEVMAGGTDYDSRRAWAQSQYQAAKNSYLNVGVPAEKLFVIEHVANTVAGTGWGRGGIAAADWDQVLMIRQDAIYNVDFAGFLTYAWGGNGMGVTEAEQIQHEYYYRSRLTLRSEKPQWLSDSAINVNGTVIPLSWSQPLNWKGGVPNAPGAEVNFWRTLTANRAITLDGSKTVGTMLFDSGPSYTINPGTGGSIIFSSPGGLATLTSNQGAHTINTNVQLNSSLVATVNASTFTINGSVSGGSAFTKSGAGTLVLGGANSYSGATIITEGILRVGSTLATAGGSITVQPAARLEASGTIPRALVNDGTVAGPVAPAALALTGLVTGNGAFTGNVHAQSIVSPGGGLGTLTFQNLTLSEGSMLNIEIGGLNPSVQFDRLVVFGAASLGGQLTAMLVQGFVPIAGDSFDILDWSTLSGSFSTLQLPALAAGLIWNTSQLYSAGVLSVALAGDFNNDGTVDAADYILWRKTGGSAEEYDAWRANLGRSAVSGDDNIAAHSSVPEPNAAILAAVAALSLTFIGRQSNLSGEH